MKLQLQLAALENAGLLSLATTQPDLEYRFRHALIQEAAYSSLLRQDRRSLHRSVGECLEQAYPEQREDMASLLGYHFREAGDPERALAYLNLAADLALERYALPEAIALYCEALKALRQVAAGHEQILQLYTRHGRALELSGRYEEALALYHELEALSHQRGEPALRLASLLARAGLRATPTAAFDAERAPALLKQALTLADQLGDDLALCQALWTLMQAEKFAGQPARAVDYGEQALAIAREHQLTEQLAFILNDIVALYLDVGAFAEAQAANAEAERLWRELDRQPMLADCLATRTWLQTLQGQYGAVIETAGEALRISQRIGNIWGQSYSRSCLGDAYLERGEIGLAITAHEECISLGEQAGFVVPQVENRSGLALIYGRLGAVDQAYRLLDAAASIAAKQIPLLLDTPLTIEAHLRLLHGQVAQASALLAQTTPVAQGTLWARGFFIKPLVEAQRACYESDFERAVAIINQALARPRYTSLHPYGLELPLAKARALLALGELEQTRALLERCSAVAEETGGRRSLWQILALLAEIAAQTGAQQQAAALRRQAGAIVRSIAAGIPAPELRRGFVAGVVAHGLSTTPESAPGK